MTRKYGGTGLGLAISRKMAQLMGGEVGFECPTTGGSRFWFSACFEPAPDEVRTAPAFADAEACEASLRRRHPGAYLLVAEDEPVSREIALDLLLSAGLRVDTAADGEAALDLARGRRYDLILMDMQMPRLNGVDATRAIRAESPNTATPIVAMTANAFESDRRLCLDAGMNDHIGKPVEPALLFQTVLKWLDHPPAGPSARKGSSDPDPGGA
jgi:CheY-like chemotaxis protein